MSEVRPRFAYRVREIQHRDAEVTWDAARKAEARQLVIDVDRVAATAVPAAARVHPWRWDARGAKTQRR